MTSSICGLDRSARAIAADLERGKSRGAKKSPARAGLSLQEEPSNVTFIIDECNSAADCTRDVMAIKKNALFTAEAGPAALAGVFAPRLGID
jgi:hypothetical protein